MSIQWSAKDVEMPGYKEN